MDTINKKEKDTISKKDKTKNVKNTRQLNIFNCAMVFAILVLFIMPFAFAAPNAVDLGSAKDFVILAKTGISTTGVTSIVGDIGVSPIDSTAITGFGALPLDPTGQFSTSILVSGKIYAADYAVPTQSKLNTAISDMETAYANALLLPTDVLNAGDGAGEIGGLTLVTGVYTFTGVSSNVLISSDLILNGDSNDVWIFQIPGTFNLANDKKVNLTGGAIAKNIFWIVEGATTLGTDSVLEGTIIDATNIVMQTNAVLTGRALAQTAVSLDSNPIIDDSTIDVTAPVITLVGGDVNVDYNSVYIDAGATAFDDVDGNLTDLIVVVNPVDTMVVGTYVVTYDVNDSNGNQAVQVIRTVNVVDSNAQVINSCAELQAINDYPDNNYVLGGDVDCLETKNWNDGNGFLPITNFSGNFDGNNHKINSLYINRSNVNKVGLFGNISSAVTIKNVGLVDLNITGNGQYGGGALNGLNVGGLVGYVSGNVTLSNTYTTGNITGAKHTGGLIGYSSSGKIIDSYSATNVTGTEHVGGLVGYGSSGKINNSYGAGNVNGIIFVGGLVGYNYVADINNSYNSGSINGTSFVGGVVGYNNSGKVNNSYNVGDVNGKNAIGGLIGYSSQGEINNSYSDGNISGELYAGGLIGSNYNGNISNSYAIGTTLGTMYVGGLVGYNKGNVIYSFSVGNVDGIDYVGGLIGFSDGGGSYGTGIIDINNSYSISKVTQSSSTNSNIKGFLGLQKSEYVKIFNVHWNPVLSMNSNCYKNYLGIDSNNNCTAITLTETDFYGSEGIPFTDLNWDTSMWIANSETYPTLSLADSNGVDSNVVVDVTAPVITLVGGDVNVDYNSVYIDAGATAFDDVDGNLTDLIVVVNPVDTMVVGTYVVTYDVNDSNGNQAVQVSRTVNVMDPAIPSVTITSPVNGFLTNDNTPSIKFIAFDDVDTNLDYTIYVDENIDSNGTITNGSEIEISLSSYTYGAYYVKVVVKDNNGNSSSDTILVNIVDYIVTSGAFVPSDINAKATDTVEATVEANIIVLMDDDHNSYITVPLGTIISGDDGSKFDLTAFTAIKTDANFLSGFEEGYVAQGALQWGLIDVDLNFNTPIQLSIWVGTEFNEQTLSIFRSSSDDSGWTNVGTTPTTCVVDMGYCDFNATKTSYYVSLTYSTPTNNTTTTNTSGGGGGSSGGNFNVTSTTNDPTCTSFTYSDWSECSEGGEQTRTILEASPNNCINGDPIVTQTCIVPTNDDTGGLNTDGTNDENIGDEANATDTNNIVLSDTPLITGLFGLGIIENSSLLALLLILLIILVLVLAKLIMARKERKREEAEKLAKANRLKMAEEKKLKR